MGGGDNGLMFWWGQRTDSDSGCRKVHVEENFLDGQGKS